MDGDFLKRLRQYAQERHIPVMREKTADLLKKCLLKVNPKKILEVGTSVGFSGILSLSVTDARLVSIEINEDIFLQAARNFKEAGLYDRARLILGDCYQTLMMIDASFDFIILDGPKGHMKELTELVFPMLNYGGVIFADNIYFHDKVKAQGFIPHKHRTIVANMRKFLDYIASNDSMKVEIYNIDDGVAVIEKIKNE
ncbi:MAG: O-methyltransferase [Christensenellales bacterium]|jgi:predicted O-methyltransferase YrrM|nr:O-methyltransferase [Clostridiales bacterium]